MLQKHRLIQKASAAVIATATMTGQPSPAVKLLLDPQKVQIRIMWLPAQQVLGNGRMLLETQESIRLT
jgi:hypothetical protein